MLLRPFCVYSNKLSRCQKMELKKFDDRYFCIRFVLLLWCLPTFGYYVNQQSVISASEPMDAVLLIAIRLLLTKQSELVHLYRSKQVYSSWLEGILISREHFWSWTCYPRFHGQWLRTAVVGATISESLILDSSHKDGPSRFVDRM